MVKNTVSDVEEPFSAEVVLGVIRDSHLQQCQYDPEAEPEADLSFNSTIEEWRYACDLVAWKPLGRAMNKWFQINHTDEEWYKVLEPSEKQTLFGVCNLIASTAKRPAIVPLQIFGNKCLDAGAFVALRTSLKNSGVPISSLKPSTQLHPWLLQYWGELSDAVGKLAPGVLPPVDIEETFIQRLSYWLVGLGILFWLVTLLTSLFWEHDGINSIAVTLFTSGFILMIVTSRMKPKRVCFDKLETFGDVCRLISKSLTNMDTHNKSLKSG
ncbi:MAG: hypothetical protein JAZ17_12520 [Candidatus Thiodiazotropha endolucinida]|nr:hypothetical protein [Candidatus Thiodiazotropha endolucinida]